MSFFIAKQGIFDSEGKRVAFEVYLRKKDNPHEYPKEVPYSRATYIIIELLLEQGLERVGEGKRVMLNVSLDSMVNKALEALEPKKTIIDLIEPQVPLGNVLYNQVVKSISVYSEKGALFCIDAKLLKDERFEKLLDFINIVSVEVKNLDDSLVSWVKSKGKMLLATRIENEKDYKKAVNYGCLLQGKFLESPIILKEFQIAPYLKVTLLKLLATLSSAQSTKEVADIISTDVGMSAKLLRLVNSAYYSPIKEINSIQQACAMLGLKNLRNIILVLAMNDYMTLENPQLWRKSLIRALIAQKIAKYLEPQQEEDAYLAGLFSLIDEILGVNKIEFLRESKVSQKVIDGYTGENEKLRTILDTAIALEEISEDLSKEEANNLLEKLEKRTGIIKPNLIKIVDEARNIAEQIIRV